MPSKREVYIIKPQQKSNIYTRNKHSSKNQRKSPKQTLCQLKDLAKKKKSLRDGEKKVGRGSTQFFSKSAYRFQNSKSAYRIEGSLDLSLLKLEIKLKFSFLNANAQLEKNTRNTEFKINNHKGTQNYSNFPYSMLVAANTFCFQIS